MTFYHGTTEETYEKIVKEGILYGVRGMFDGHEIDRCTYLAVDAEEAKQYGPVLLQVEYDPFVSKHNNYKEGCWQIRVYEPIPLQNIIKLEKLQNNFTTPEQSKRLLELGVPADSANHYYGKDGKLHYIDGAIPYSLLWATGCIPCWSVGRLIEILRICYNDTASLMLQDCTVGYFVGVISCQVKLNHLDFSKLED